MDVGRKPGVRPGVRPRELDARRKRPARSAIDRQLVAGHVQLRRKRVQRNDLCPEKIVPRGEGRGDGHVDAAAALVHVLGAPVVVVADARVGGGPGVLVDLEPGGRAVGGGGVGDGGEVDHCGAVVGAADGLAGAGAVTVLL